MSTSSAVLTRPAGRPSGAVARSADLRLFRSEVRLVLGRRRNLALIAVLCCFPVLIGLAVHHSPTTPGDGPPFLSQVTDNGLFLVFTSLTVLLPFFLPLAVAVTAGESVAGEASIGTLRNLLVVPVSRTRLLVVKYAASVVFAFVCVAAVALVGVVVGLVLFPHGDVTLLSGTTVSYGEALWRSLLVLGYVTAMLAGLAAIGLFVSTLTEVPIGAMAATAVLAIISQIADSIPQISAIHPYLFSHPWMRFGDVLRSPMSWHGLEQGLLTQLAYLAVFLPAAWARLRTKDITA
ncbi:MAG: type transport system permease protein [Actinomycetota bacterium]|jgi:ABC-2 type transport system permease protein|nr:type transport system permease protein [Actinomycetota bacterium]